jgi:hypothetical protein
MKDNTAWKCNKGTHKGQPRRGIAHYEGRRQRSQKASWMRWWLIHFENRERNFANRSVSPKNTIPGKRSSMVRLERTGSWLLRNYKRMREREPAGQE